MQFLVRIAVDLPHALSEQELDAVRRAELARGRELVDAGSIVSIWRIPGGLRNVGVWEATDATELHDLISSLPMFPWITAEVTPLAVHPLNRPDER